MKHFLPKADGSFFVVHEDEVVDVRAWDDTTSIVKCRDGSTCTVEMSVERIHSLMRPRTKLVYITGVALGLAVGLTDFDVITCLGAVILSVEVYRHWLI